MKTIQCDTLIIGSGLAGLMAAHSLSSSHYVICLTKGNWNECNSYLAQGGIACVTSPEDHWKLHSEDTFLAGRFHNAEEHVHALTQESPQIIKKLVELGVPFDHDSDGNFLRTREGGHGLSRILHAGGDASGMKIMETLYQKLPPNIDIHPFTQAVELFVEDGVCKGVWARDPVGNLNLYIANYTVLASGGLGQLYNHTTNARTITGDGLAMAYQAGAQCSDLEFVQFHPTLLAAPNSKGDLISEAVRGEGAILVNQNDEPIMKGIHPLRDLAPRDIVARTIYQRILIGDSVYLDISRIEDFKSRFPTISRICLTAGISLSEGRIPVSPGAHFIMGGIETDSWGQTTIERLFAIGETACTGIHGANRLASNSLLEAAGYGIKAGNLINNLLTNETRISWSAPALTDHSQSLELPKSELLQKKVSECLGIIREPERLLELKSWLMPYIEAFESFQGRYFSKDESERWNMTLVAYLMTLSMLERTESRGAHYRLDYPTEQPNWLKKRLTRGRVAVEHF